MTKTIVSGICATAIIAVAVSRAHAEALEEIIVTAQKREESVMRIPIAIGVLSAEQLARSGIHNTADLQLVTPGLYMSTSAASGQLYLRGIGTDLLGVGMDGSVAVYVDGVYQARPSGALRTLYDVQRVEVLKGPQGTLYGRNATGGAINILSVQPGKEFTATGSAEYGDYDQTRLNIAVGGPLGTPAVRARVAVSHSENSGYTDNVLLDEEADRIESSAVRASVALDLAENAELLLAGNYSESQEDRVNKPINLDTNPLFTVFGATAINNPRKVMLNQKADIPTEQRGASARLRWDLGAVTLTSISAWQQLEYGPMRNDGDGTELPVLQNGTQGESNGAAEGSDTFTQELLLSSNAEGPWEWTAGLFYLAEDADFQTGNALPLFSTFIQFDADAEVEASAVYGQASYRLTDTLRFALGGRYSRETKDFSIFETFSPGGAPVIGPASDSKDWSSTTGRASLEYLPDEHTLFYLSVSRGFKSGGFNSVGFSATGQPDEFDPEYVWAYEAGVKFDALDGRVRADANVYYYDYTDLQVSQFLPPALTTVENAASATVTGIEINLAAQPLEGLEINAGAAYNDATFDRYVVLDTDHPELGFVDRGGNPLPRAPEWSFNAGIQYAFRLADAGTLTLRGEYMYRSEVYFTAFEDDRVRQEPVDLFNARLSFATGDEHWRVAAFVNNIGDETYADNIFTFQSVIGQQAIFAPPRTYGVQIGFDF